MHFGFKIFDIRRNLGLVGSVLSVEFLTVVVATGCYGIPRLLMVSKLIHRMLRLVRKIVWREVRFEVDVLRLQTRHWNVIIELITVSETKLKRRDIYHSRRTGWATSRSGNVVCPFDGCVTFLGAIVTGLDTSRWWSRRWWRCHIPFTRQTKTRFNS